jgi:hypothetical protein
LDLLVSGHDGKAKQEVQISTLLVKDPFKENLYDPLELFLAYKTLFACIIEAKHLFSRNLAEFILKLLVHLREQVLRMFHFALFNHPFWPDRVLQLCVSLRLA